MTHVQLRTAQLELRPLAAGAAAVLPGGRASAAARVGASLPPGWPLADLLDVLPMEAAASPVRTLRRAGFVESGKADGALAWRFAGAASPG